MNQPIVAWYWFLCALFVHFYLLRLANHPHLKVAIRQSLLAYIFQRQEGQVVILSLLKH